MRFGLTSLDFRGRMLLVMKMQTKENVLRLLISSEDGISGGMMASLLGVSRNAVWKVINQLKADGFDIEAVSGKGYKLSGGNLRLSEAELQKHYDRKVIFLEQTDSTNRVAKSLAEQGADEGTLIVALSQTAGRGRLGRSFLSPEGGLYFSLVLRPSFSPEESRMLTVAAAVATAQAIEQTSGKKCDIKWVNDIYIGGKKVCGILTEGAFDAETGTLKYAVLGIGINIFAPDGLPDEISDIADTVFDGDVPSKIKAELIAKIVNNFMAFYKKLDGRAFLEEYRRRSMLTGLDVCYTLQGAEHTGRVLGIDDEARLIVEENGKEVYIGAGDVSVRWRK